MQSVFITGGHKGLGLESVKRIASTGRFDLVLGGRNLAEVRPVVEGLRQEYNIKARALHLDIASLQSARAAAVEFKRIVATGEVGPLQSLMLNAGAQFLGPVSFSPDNYEMTFATNALGNFLLFNLLLDDINDGGRIVVTASGTPTRTRWTARWLAKQLQPMRSR
jgi:NAD(P)-dependent dehydrogenase (short-subunit alcohol dehydrogenase family)